MDLVGQPESIAHPGQTPIFFAGARHAAPRNPLTGIGARDMTPPTLAQPDGPARRNQE
jgi:hypothetical protein